MPIAFNCPQCSREFSLPGRLAGTVHRCMYCGRESPVLGVQSDTIEMPQIAGASGSGLNRVAVPAAKPPAPSGSGVVALTPSGKLQPGTRPCPACGKRIAFNAATCESCGRSMTVRLQVPNFVNVGLLRHFRIELFALAGVMLFHAAMLGGRVALPQWSGWAVTGPDGSATAWANVFGAAAAFWLGCAVLTLLRQVWAAWAASVAALAWLAVEWRLWTEAGLLSVIAAVAIVAQTIRVAGWAREMRAAGLSLWTRAKRLEPAADKPSA